ncbi:MAG: hypothetical protein ABIR96_08565 [Bdellovibrionota bacterium]
MIKIKWNLKMAAVLGIALAGHAHAHGDGRVGLELESSRMVSAGKISLSFDLVDQEERKVLSDTDLAVSHENKLHLFAFDTALKEFRHVHPVFANGKWSVTLDLSTNGTYKIWTQGQMASDGDEFSATDEIVVSGGVAANPTPPVLVDQRSGEDRGSQVAVSNVRLRAGRMAMPTLTFSRVDGLAPVITPYLGETAHVVTTSEDGSKLIHSHPMEHNGQFMLHMEFPDVGFYRMWIQFIEHGELKNVPVSVEVFQ